jgi:type I restriction enzyme S subunit
MSQWGTATLGELTMEGPTNGYSGATSSDAMGSPTLRLSATTSGSLVLNDTTTKRLNETIPPDSDLWLRPGDLLVQRSNTIDLVGTAAIYDGPPGAFVYPDLMMRIRLRADTDSRFIWRYLNSPVGRTSMRRIASGSAGSMPKISGARLRTILVPVPPLREQRRIAEILDKADALRAKRCAALAQLDTLTQSIFLDMFGDPATNPKGWPMRRIEEVCGLVNGRAFKPDEWEETGLPIIRIQNLNDASKPFNYTTRALPERFRVKKGDILFSWSGTPGTSFGCFRWDGPEGWLNQHIFNVRLNGSVDGAFFINQVNLKLGELILKAHGGVGLQHVTKSMIDETHLMIPPPDLQRAFARMTGKVDCVRQQLIGSQAALGRLFECVRDQAFRGDLVLAGHLLTA